MVICLASPSEVQIQGDKKFGYHILPQYLSAYMDLQGVLLGVDSGYDEKPPAEGVWPLRRIIAHKVGADLGFYVTIKYTLDKYRKRLDPLVEVEDET